VTDLVGSAFPDLMRDLVLAPLGMKHSSYEQPPSSTLADRAAVGHPWNGIPTPDGWHVHPEMAAAGLWSTAGDLARLGAALMRGLRGEITGLGLSQESLAAMLRPQLPDQPIGSDFVGLAWFCAGDGDAFRFGHTGGNHGFLANLRLHPATGQGAAVMINSNQGSPLIEELLASIEREYCWPAAAQAASVTIADQLAGTYRDSTNRIFQIEQVGGRLQLRVGDQDPFRLIPFSNGVLSAQMLQTKVRLAPTPEGLPAIILTQGDRTFGAIRVPEG
jgi:CubicO group peptidase (beta-lactamase class C family)